jgi:hypothetical protein
VKPGVDGYSPLAALKELNILVMEKTLRVVVMKPVALKEPNMNNPRLRRGLRIHTTISSSEGAEYVY